PFCINIFSFFFQAEDGIRDATVTGVQTCALPISDGATETRAELILLVLRFGPSRFRKKILGVELGVAEKFVSAAMKQIRSGLRRSEERRVGKECRSRWGEDMKI